VLCGRQSWISGSSAYYGGTLGAGPFTVVVVGERRGYVVVVLAIRAWIESRLAIVILAVMLVVVGLLEAVVILALRLSSLQVFVVVIELLMKD